MTTSCTTAATEPAMPSGAAMRPPAGDLPRCCSKKCPLKVLEISQGLGPPFSDRAPENWPRAHWLRRLPRGTRLRAAASRDARLIRVALPVKSYLSNAASFVLCAAHRVKDHRKLLHCSPRLKKTCVRQVVLDKRFPLTDDSIVRAARSTPARAHPSRTRPLSNGMA